LLVGLGMHRSLLILGILLTQAIPCPAATVLRLGKTGHLIAISQETWRQWKVDDRVCVWKKNEALGCGKVIKSSQKGAVVKLERDLPQMVEGDEVRMVGAERQTNAVPYRLLDSTEGNPEILESTSSVPENDLTAGISVGLSFFFPVLHYQRALSPNFAIGIMPVYFHTSSGDSSVGALGIQLTANYYGNDFFRGLWVQFGTGIYSFSATVSNGDENGRSIAFLGTVGWRSSWALGLNVGVAAGLQYLSDPHLPSVDVRAASVQPVVILDVGVGF
jgi:hypothetical protein